MTAFALTAAMVAAGILWGCRTSAGSHTTSDTSISAIGATPSTECGLLRWWRMPEVDVVERETDPQLPHVTKAGLNLIAAAAERYCLTHGRYPKSVDDLRQEAVVLPRGTRCRLDAAFLLDEWDTAINYTVDRQGVPHLVSAGPDRVQGTADDLSLPAPGDPEGEELNGRIVCKV